MNESVLIISPTPTHPSSAGNRVHILSFAKILIAKGLDVHFLYLAFEDLDEKAMRAFWNDRLYIVPREVLYGDSPGLPVLAHKVKFKLRGLLRRVQKLTGIISRDQFLYNSETDFHFPPQAVPFIENIRNSRPFKMVICEYAFMSKALTLFPRSVFKVLDTHDRFSDRFSVYQQHKLPPRWISLYRDQEKKALNRANLVIAVQEEEKSFFESISRARVARFTYLPEVTALPVRKFEKKLLFFASDNDLNHNSLNNFIQTVLPVIVARHADAQVLIGGSICRGFSTHHPNIVLKGTFDNISDFYACGDIAINPEISGTGYKIKTLEALSFGLPTVSTTAGASGVLEPFSEHILIADEPARFADAVVKLIEKADMREALAKNALSWYKQFREKTTGNLVRELEQTGFRPMRTEKMIITT